MFAREDFAIEDAIIAMHEGSYAGSQTGATAARLAGASARKAGMAKARSLHTKMMAVDKVNLSKEQSGKRARDKSHELFMDVAFAPVHGFRPAAPAMESKKSKAGLLLGLAGTGLQGFKAYKGNRAPKVLADGTEVTKGWGDREMVGNIGGGVFG